MLKKLNWGCGSIMPADWDNLDNDPSFGALFQDTNLISSNTYDIIVAHCSLQMNDWHELPGVLENLYRILKPGGVLRISLPDIVAGFGALIEDNKDWFPNGEEDLDERFCAWLTWYSTSKTLLTQKALFDKLIKANFREIGECGFKESRFLVTPEIIELDTRENEVYFMEAVK